MKARSIHKSSTMLRQEFLRKWIKGIQICKVLDTDMTTGEKKNAIKVSADVAIASTRDTKTKWGRALMADVVSQDETTGILVEQLSGTRIAKNGSTGIIRCSRKFMRKSNTVRRKARRVVPRGIKASCIAKKLVKNRTRVLKSIVPGGKELDEGSLIRETLDYIMSLRVQVDVMRRIASAVAGADGTKGGCN